MIDKPSYIPLDIDLTNHKSIRDALDKHFYFFTCTPAGRVATIIKDRKSAPGYRVACWDDDEDWKVAVMECYDKNLTLNSYLLMLDCYANKRSIARGLA